MKKTPPVKNHFHINDKSSPVVKTAPTKPSNAKRIILSITIFLFLISFSLFLIIWWYLSSFSQAAGVPSSQLIASFRTGLNTTPKSTDNKTQILILGIDEIENQKENSLLTDTIIVASFDHQTKKLTLISLPRDLWIDSLKTKINSLYYFGQVSPKTSGSGLVSTVIEEITGLPSHYTFLIKLNSLEEVINTLGGVSINVPQTFTDTRFPRSDVDIQEATEEELYETITFQQGIQVMDGITALKYIRSRQSENEQEGTDLARSARQQQLIKAIITKISNSNTLKNPNTLGNLYNVYKNQMETNLTDEELVALAKINGRTIPTIANLSLPVTTGTSQGLIFNPPIRKFGLWVYEPLDPSWQQTRDFMSDNL